MELKTTLLTEEEGRRKESEASLAAHAQTIASLEKSLAEATAEVDDAKHQLQEKEEEYPSTTNGTHSEDESTTMKALEIDFASLQQKYNEALLESNRGLFYFSFFFSEFVAEILFRLLFELFFC